MTQILSKLTKTTPKSLRKLIKLVNKDGGKLNHRHTSFILFSFSHSLALHDKGFYDAGRWIYEWGSEATRCLECQMRQKEGCSMSICMSYQIRFIDLITSLSVDDEPAEASRKLQVVFHVFGCDASWARLCLQSVMESVQFLFGDLPWRLLSPLVKIQHVSEICLRLTSGRLLLIWTIFILLSRALQRAIKIANCRFYGNWNLIVIESIIDFSLVSLPLMAQKIRFALGQQRQKKSR